MQRASWVVERMLICRNCGVPVEILGDGVSVWVHADDGYRTCAWVGMEGRSTTYAAPTDWFDAEQWDAVGYMSAEEARVLGGW